VGWLPTLRPDQRRKLAYSGVDTLAAVHAMDWREMQSFVHRDEASVPGLSSHLSQLAHWYRWAAAGRDYPITDAALTYLLDRQRRVEAGEPVLLWGDARLGNMMFDESTADVSAVLDWECAAIGPAGVDIAHWLVFDEFATTACGVKRLDGYPDRDAILARYKSVSGRHLLDLDFFEIVQCLFLATTLIRQADAAVRSGRLAPDTRMGHDNALTQMLARRLGLPVPELAADYLTHRRGSVVGGQDR
jgi:aminoglycoside phosphotransferase (APT) family kinase protein